MDDPRFPKRKSPRLPGHDYGQTGMYFVTTCVQNREWVFGEVIDSTMRLNALGHLAAACWLALPGHVPGIELDEYVVMPNHVHGLLTLRERIDPISSSSILPVRRITLSQVVALYKAAVTRAANRMIRPAPGSIWQTRFYERMVRDDTELNRFREYLIHNPARWQEDQFYSPKP